MTARKLIHNLIVWFGHTRWGMAMPVCFAPVIEFAPLWALYIPGFVLGLGHELPQMLVRKREVTPGLWLHRQPFWRGIFDIFDFSLGGAFTATTMLYVAGRLEWYCWFIAIVTVALYIWLGHRGNR